MIVSLFFVITTVIFVGLCTLSSSTVHLQVIEIIIIYHCAIKRDNIIYPCLMTSSRTFYRG